MNHPLETHAAHARRDWTGSEIKRLLGPELGAGWAIARGVMASLDVAGSHDEALYIDRGSRDLLELVHSTLTSRTVLAEGVEDDLRATGIAYLANTASLSIPFLLDSVGSSKQKGAFRNGLHAAVELIPHFATQRGISPLAAEDIARDICEQLGMLRGRDLRQQLLAGQWDEEAASAVSNIHQQLTAIGCPGLSLDEAEAILRGGPDARAGLDRLEAEQGIDVGRMRKAIAYIPDTFTRDDLESLCEGHDLIVRRGQGEEASSPDGLPQWEWVSADGAQVSNLYFGSEREAQVAALEEKLLPEWFAAGQYEMDFPDFMEAARPGSSNRP
ncbi:hypothetical protein LJR168_003775 [Pseudoxanthomonas sp. LjRoot168]|uniref:hypothetical protein n=1 Tax=unclassified Pseudoxanthomonas TaxID=2645906 RepID=UPI003ECDEE02